MINRVILIVLDSVGMGEAPDADKFGDIGANTLGHIAASKAAFKIDNLRKLGLGNIDGMANIKGYDDPIGCYARLTEQSAGKDTIIGHWEISGLLSNEPFPTYPHGFPEEIIKKLEVATERKILANKPASGTEIIKEYGEEHIRTGSPIIYTSADSVFQIAAHEKIIPVDELYDICLKARELLTGENSVARVIARPFIGKPGEFVRTSNRKDFALNPPRDTLLDKMQKKGYTNYAVGRIQDIFNGKGIADAAHIEDNQDGVIKTLEYMKQNKKGIIFTNLEDFDMKWGHRRDVAGYANELEAFDTRLPEIIEEMRDDDLLMITADHGNDPTFKGTDHTREYVPLLIYGKTIKQGINLGTRCTYADVAQTIAEIFEVEKTEVGTSFLREIM